MKTRIPILFRLLAPLLLCISARLFAQIVPQDVNQRVTTEVSGVTLPAGQLIFVAAMEGPLGTEETAVYVGTGGAPWQQRLRVIADTTYERSPDPVLATDGINALYLEVMRIKPNSATKHIALYASTDQGNTWQLRSYPYFDISGGDYPAITALPGGFVATSYTVYAGGSWVEFVRSTDGGFTWTPPLRFNAFPSLFHNTAIGSDLCWQGNRLCLSYGDYNIHHLYFTSSLDSGLTWAPLDSFPTTDNHMITKLVPSPTTDTLFYIAHRPHANQTDIHLHASYNVGQSWTHQVIASNAGYGEGIQSAPGILDIVYNETDAQDSFSIQYIWSEDAGQTFSNPVTLWKARQNHIGQGEYQAFLPAASGNGFDLIFVDDSDHSELKYLHFTHALIPVGLAETKPDYLIYPNPTRDKLKIQLVNQKTAQAQYRLCDLQGRITMQGKIRTPNTILDLQELAAGTYLLLMECGTRIDVQRVVKE